MSPPHARDGRGRRPVEVGADRPQRPVPPGHRLAQREGLGHVLGGDDDSGHAPVGRRADHAPLGGLGAPEPLLVARQDRADHRVLRLVRLQEGEAGSPGAPRPASDLAHQLEGALGRAQVGPEQPQIRVDHADQRQRREVVALGDQLRADDDVGGALGDRADLLLQRPRAAEEVG